MSEEELLNYIKTDKNKLLDINSDISDDLDIELLINLIEKQQKEIEELKEDNKEYECIIDMQNKREYRSKFLKDFQKENGKNMFPDYDEIYKRYDKQKEEIDNLKLKIQQKEITAEAFKNALGDIVEGKKWCKDIESDITIYINPNENLSDEELDDLIKVYTEWEKEGIGFKKIRTRAILGLLNIIKKQREKLLEE